MANFTNNGMWFSFNDLMTPALQSFMKKHGLTVMENTLVPVHRKYENGIGRRNSEYFIAKCVMSGYPNTIATIKGSKTIQCSPARHLYRIGHYSNNVEDPVGSSKTVFTEMKNLASSFREMVMMDNVKIGEYQVERNMFITDVWEQDISVDLSILFFTAYCRVVGMPENWYTRIMFFEDPDTGLPMVFPQVIGGFNTIKIDPKSKFCEELIRVGNIHTDLQGLKAGYDRMFKFHPLWTLSEMEFEAICPVIWARNKHLVPELFTDARGDLAFYGNNRTKPNVQYRLLNDMKSDDDYSKYVITTQWLDATNFNNGIAIGYMYNIDKDRIERHYVKSYLDAEHSTRKAVSLGYIDHISTSEYDSVQEDDDIEIIFRYGFKKEAECLHTKAAELVQHHHPRQMNQRQIHSDRREGFNTINIPTRINTPKGIIEDDPDAAAIGSLSDM